MTEITDLSPTDSSNTAVSGFSTDGTIANMSTMDNVIQGVLGMIGRWTSSDTIASAGTTDIGGQAEAYLNITGTTTITSFGTVRSGTIRFVKFAGILTLTYNASSLILPTAANITTAANDTAVLVSEGSGNWRCLVYTRADGQAAASSGVPGYIYGLALTTNASDATNDIDIAAGMAVDSTGLISLTLPSALGKRLDAAWTVGGTPAAALGGLDTGAVGNNTYYIWLIKRPDTGVVDVLFSLSNSAPTMPANYTLKILIGSVVRSGGVNRPPYFASGLAWVQTWPGQGQIQFPATQNASSNANTLDDYAELSTAPTITATSGTFISVGCDMRFTKVGRLVTFSGSVNLQNTGSAAGNISIPLPYTPTFDGGGGGAETTATGYALSVTVASGSPSLAVFKYDGTTIIASGRFLRFSGNFIV